MRWYVVLCSVVCLQNVGEYVGGDDCVVVVLVVLLQDFAEPFGRLEVDRQAQVRLLVSIYSHIIH